MIIDRILPLLEGIKKTGHDRYICRCPAHIDKNPSMNIKQVDDRVLIHCFAGCSVSQIMESIGLKMEDLFPDRPNKPVPRGERFNPYDVLKCLETHLTIIELAVNDLAKLGAHFSQKDAAIVSMAANNIKESLAVVRGH